MRASRLLMVAIARRRERLVHRRSGAATLGHRRENAGRTRESEAGTGTRRTSPPTSTRMSSFTAEMNDMVFSFGELGFQEFETSKYLTGILEKNGFTVAARPRRHPDGVDGELGIGQAGHRARLRHRRIPQASQKPGVAYHDPIIEGAPGHGEGHNSGMPLNITAALAVKKIMEREHLPGTMRLWPGVAEELVGAKAYFVRAGAFKDVDIVALHARRREHAGDAGATATANGAGLGRVQLQGRERARGRRAVARPLARSTRSS